MSMMRYTLDELERYVSRFYKARKFSLVPYAYNVTFTALAQNGTQTQTVSISAQGDFILTDFAHRAQIGAAQTISTKTAPFVRLLITDTGTNERFTDTAVDLENLSTNGGDDRGALWPRIVSGRSTLQLVATNYAPTAETYTTIDVMMRGALIRVYR